MLRVRFCFWVVIIFNDFASFIYMYIYRLCRNPVRPPVHILKGIGNGILTLADMELTLKELPAVHRFLQSKAVWVMNAFHDIIHTAYFMTFFVNSQALQGIHTLVLCRVAQEGAGKRLRATHDGESNVYSAFAMERGKLLRSIPNFVAKAVNLSTITIDSINVTPEFLNAASNALIATNSCKTHTCCLCPLFNRKYRHNICSCRHT